MGPSIVMLYVVCTSILVPHIGTKAGLCALTLWLIFMHGFVADFLIFHFILNQVCYNVLYMCVTTIATINNYKEKHICSVQVVMQVSFGIQKMAVTVVVLYICI